ncbi:MAG: PAS domain S-box protein [Gemmatimonadota bacterium]
MTLAMAEDPSLTDALSRIARLAARSTSAAALVVHARSGAGVSFHGDRGLAKNFTSDTGLVADLLAAHDQHGDRLVATGVSPAHAGLEATLTRLQQVQSLATFAIRGEDNSLSGILAVAAPEPVEWGGATLDDLADLATLAASAIGRLPQESGDSWADEAVEIQTAYLDQLFESAPEAIAMLDAEGRILRVNAQYTRMYGYTAKEAIGRKPADLTIPTEEVDDAREMGRRAARGEEVRTEVVRRRKDGTRFPVALVGIPVRINRGQVGVYAISRDLTPVRNARVAIQRKEERFRSLIENSMDLVAIVAASGWIDYVTPSVSRLLGHDPSALVGTSAFGLVHPDDAPAVIARFTSLIRGECAGSFEFRLRDESEAWRTFEVRAKNMIDDPAVGGIVINGRDVTDERAAKKVQRRLDAFLEATPDFVATFDPHGRALSINRAFRALLGIEDPGADLLAQLTLEDLFPREVMERLLHEGIPSAMRSGGWSGETFLRGTDGAEIPTSQVVLAHRSPSGTVEFLSTLARDITAQKEAETALRRSEAHFRSLIDNAADIITIVDPDGKILFVSPSVRRVLGYEPDEVLGSSIFSLVQPEEIPVAVDNFTNVMQKAEPGDPAEFGVLHKDGSWRRLESVSESLLNDPAVGGVVINSRDITDRRQAEEALGESRQQLLQAQKMEAVGRLAGGIAHDFNNLLTAIKGFTELLLLDFEKKDPRRNFVTEIQGAATRAAGLTRQLLAFSRRQVLQPEVLDLNATVAEMEKMLERLVGEDLRMITELEPDLGRVKADPGQVEQVVMNLVVNARDAMPTGGELRIRTANATLAEADIQRYPYVQPGEYVLLEVGDTGAGMSREIQDRIFEPFFTTKEQGKGTGLGLSTVYGIIKQSGGYIWVDSELEHGTTFRIYLPRVDAQVAERAAEREDEGSLDGSESVLLVEDEMAVRVLVRRVLERAGYQVVEAACGPEALERAADAGIGEFDLLLTDVVMPGMSGRELADQLCEQQPDLRVLYMSGYTDEAIVHHGVLDEGVAFLEKPFTPDVLLRRLRAVFDSPISR